MIKSLLIMGTSILAAAVTGVLHREVSAARTAAKTLQQRTIHLTTQSENLTSEMAELHTAIARKTSAPESDHPVTLDPEVAAWLLKGNYGIISEGLVPKVFTALDFPWEGSTNYVLVSKGTLREITVSWNSRGTNMLGDWVCGLLAITPEERVQIDSAVDRTRNYFI